MTAKEKAELAWQALRQGRPCPADAVGVSSAEEGYRVQLELLALRLAAGAGHVGWKVGLTAKATQDYLGHHERIFGYLLDGAELQPGALPAFGHLQDPLFEPELCVVLSEPLQGPGVSNARARAAIGAVAPAVEVVEVRGRGGGDLPLILADNSAQRHFMTGPFTASLAPDADLQAVTVEIVVNGETVERAGGHEVMVGAVGSVAWLAIRLSHFGRRLEAGVKVMTGSFS